MISRRIRTAWLIALIAAIATACGGGSSTATNTGGGGNNGGGGNTGGITRTGVGVAFGPITGFNSVIVNGIEYETNAATQFIIDGDPNGSQDDLSVGDIVLVRGTIDDDNTNAVAESVEFDDVVEGPIAAGSRTANSFVVLGQTVLVDDFNTSWDDGISPPTVLGGLADGDIVEVAGQIRPDGSVAATRIERKAVPPLEFEVTGTVSEPITATTFMINSLVVDFATRSAPFDNFPGGRAVMAGDPVEVKGETTLGPGGELIATRVEYKGDRLAGDEGDHIEIEGFIKNFMSITEFDVGDVAVTTDGNTTYEGGDESNLGDNVKVEVEGEYNDTGALLATKIQFKLGEAVRIAALVDTKTLPNDIVMLGITIETDPLVTRFEDKTGDIREGFGVADINTPDTTGFSDYVEIRGQEIPLPDGSGSGIVFAALLERDDPDPDTIIQGFVQTVSDPDYAVLGVTIRTDGDTLFFREEPDGSVSGISSAIFFGTDRTGALVKAKGTSVTAGPPVSLLADEVEIQFEPD